MITFDSQNINMPALDFDRVGEWLKVVASNFGKRISRLSYLFCDDEEILRVNREFLGHDYFTDIITFDYSSADRIGGDMIISLETVASNAEEMRVDYREELLRVIAHGVLHLCGVNDKGPGEREIMEREENRALSIWKEMNQ